MGGEITVLSPASSRSRSLRTTVPMSIVKQFELNKGDRLRWEIQARGNEIIVVVEPLKEED